MSLGHINRYKVIRETKLGYVLYKDGIEYFLHHNECNGRLLYNGDYVNAFLYADKLGRIAATLYPPLVESGQINFLEVKGVKEEIGVFCDIGISKDILLSRDDLPRDFKEWPKVGEKIVGELRTKNERLVIKMATKTQILNKIVENKATYNDGDVVSGVIYKMTDEGISLATNDFQILFIYKTNYRGSHHLGETLDVKIIDVKDDYYNGTIIKNKEFQIQDDEAIILDYLNKNNGVSLITDKSSPDLIKKVLNMSKRAYKDALGGLLKQGKIIITDTKIILNDLKF